MKKEIYIRYVGTEEDDSVIPFSELGESLIGWDQSVRELTRILRVESDVELRAHSTSDGSLVIDTLLQIAGSADSLFSNAQAFLEFARLCGGELWRAASEFFSSIEDAHKSVNDFAAKYPFDIGVLALLIPYLIKRLGEIGEKKKLKSEEEIIQELRDDIPERIARELIKLLKKKSLSKVVRPITEEVATSVEIDTDRSFKNPTKIDRGNFQNFLSEDDQVLPDYENGQTYPFDGEITSIKSTRGDSMTFHTEIDGSIYNLDLLPKSGLTTKSYLDFYQENVHVLATVIRTSLYKKPKLQVFQIDLNQKKLDLD